MKSKSSPTKIIEPIQEVYKPTFDIPENFTQGIGDKKIGEKITLLVNFEVVEKTKSYTITRIENAVILKTKRTY